jgi:ubiquinone/menaquinone biosynthesis C-methylase UbiE
MKNFKAEMFNKKAAHPSNRPDEVIKALELKPGQVIADIGAGGGYFTLRFAEIVGEQGKVYGIDTNPEFLQFIRDNAEKKKLKNIYIILVRDKLELPQKIIDLFFMRNVTHHLKNRVDYFKNLRQFLKPDGKIAVIEYHKNSFHLGHNVPKETIIEEMKKAGYLLEKEFNFLPEQHFTIYRSV